ncbi:MAG: endonuclease/exonuclease/phosphatase family protein [Muribaculaceae bacterium]|nr:endonuclease/exonuclease/phosphatase family protein [Muribaculaceae bacterium]
MNLRLLSFAFAVAGTLTMSAARPQVVAHRGYWNAPGSAQNSIRALVKADSIGADAVELDVWISADNVLYVNHDPDFKGVNIEKSDSETLSKLRLANGEPLPTLDSYLEVAKGLKPDLVVEMKTHTDPKREDVAVEKTINMITEKGLTDRTSYITFSRNSFDNLVAMSGRPVQFLSATEPAMLDKIGGDGADYHISVYRTNPQWFDELRALDKTINIWTVNSPADLKYCINHGADFITTDDPELAMQLVEEAYAPKEMKIMTYNLRFGELADMDRLAAEIKAYNPDFVAIQEVDVNTNRAASKHNNGLNYVTELAQRTGMFGYYGRAIDFGPGYYGIGILSRYPAEKIEKFELPNPGNEEPRALLIGTFELPDHKIVFACTHLDYRDHDTRKKQARFVADKLTQSPYPALLAGDFNATNGQIYIESIKAKMKELTNDRKTWPADVPQDKLDFIFGYPKENFQLKSCFVPEPAQNTASAHHPVVSDIIVNF